MSQAEDDAGLMGDALAELVDQGRITDKTAFAYMAGDKRASEIVSRELRWLDATEDADLASEGLDRYGSLDGGDQDR